MKEFRGTAHTRMYQSVSSSTCPYVSWTAARMLSRLVYPNTRRGVYARAILYGSRGFFSSCPRLWNIYVTFYSIEQVRLYHNQAINE